MSNFVSYFKEREGMDIAETEHGFVAYCFTEQKQLFCHQFFVHPDYRMGGQGKKLLFEVEDIAKKNGMETITVTVQPGHSLRHETLMAVISTGFIFKGLNTMQNLLFEKEVK